MSARCLALVFGVAAFAAPFPEPHDNQKENIPVLQPADALTKLVIACGERSAPWLRRYGAVAHAYDADAGWRTFGADTLAPDAPPARA